MVILRPKFLGRSIAYVVAGILLFPLMGSAQTSKKTAPAPKAHAPNPTSTTSKAPASAAKPTAGAAGSTRTVTTKGSEIIKGQSGRIEAIRTSSGRTATFGPDGRVTQVRDPSRSMTVLRGPEGFRLTEIERPDHTTLVADGRGRGYIQHPYTYQGHAYYSRAYYYGGRPYNAYYRGYYYNGVYLNGYMPAYYYPPVYYGWAYYPWPSPVPYAWGWRGDPWYRYYGAYFAPYLVYPSAAYWIADYLVAASLADAYAALSVSARLSPAVQAPPLIYASYDPAAGTSSQTMTMEVKDAIAEEIKNELVLQQAGAGDPQPASLQTLLADSKPHVFVASAALTVTSGSQDCALTEGDVLSLPVAPAPNTSTAHLSVIASKQADCSKGTTVAVNLIDLQEMQNHLMSSIDSAMAQMKDHPGQGGLPSPPAEAISGTRQAPYAAAAPPPDPDGAAVLDQAAKEGAEVEKQVTAEAARDTDAASDSSVAGVASPSTRPVTITLGMTPEEVIAIKGQPASKMNLPTKQIFIYPDVKITFVTGKLTDVQ